MNTEELNKIYLLLVVFVLSIVSALGYLGYQNQHLKEEKATIQEELVGTRAEFSATSESFFRSIDLMKAQTRVMSDSINVLKRLINTDRELLKKYSKVYFLNENYEPKDLFSIPPPLHI